MPPGVIAAIAARAAGLASPSGAAGRTTRTASSKATTPSVSSGARRSTSASSARRAASSRSPAIDPLRSSTTCTATGSRSSPSRSGACSSSSTVSSSSCSTATSSTSSCAFRCIPRPLSGGPRTRVGRRRRDLTPLRQVGPAERADGGEAAAGADGRPERGLAVGERRAAAGAAGLRAARVPCGELDDVVGEPHPAVARVARVPGERGARGRPVAGDEARDQLGGLAVLADHVEVGDGHAGAAALLQQRVERAARRQPGGPVDEPDAAAGDGGAEVGHVPGGSRRPRRA